MGCGDSRGVLTAEESSICSAEHKLHLQDLPVSQVCSTIKQFSGPELISDSQLLRICQRLVPDLDDPRAYRQRYFGQSFFHANPHGFSRVKILILGVLLAAGSNEEKVQELFYAVNPECAQRLEAQQVSMMVQGLVSISVIYCPLLVKDVSPALAEYKRILEHKATLVTEYAVQYLDGSWSLSSLISKFNSKELSHFLSPSGIRRTLMDFSANGDSRPNHKDSPSVESRTSPRLSPFP